MEYFVQVRRAYGDNLETVYFVTVNGYQVGGKIDKSGAGDLEFPTRQEATEYAKQIARDYDGRIITEA